MFRTNQERKILFRIMFKKSKLNGCVHSTEHLLLIDFFKINRMLFAVTNNGSY